MTKMKTPSAVIILSAAVATPVFAQDAGVLGPGSGYGFRPQPGSTYHDRAYDRWNFRGAYDQLDGPFYATPYFGFGGMDRSWVGGEDPSRRPPSSFKPPAHWDTHVVPHDPLGWSRKIFQSLGNIGLHERRHYSTAQLPGLHRMRGHQGQRLKHLGISARA
jgi:hypothetical protein